MREAWFDIIKNPAYATRRKQRKGPSKKVRSKQIGDAKAARVERKQPKIQSKKDEAVRDFDVPDTGKKNLLGRMGDRFRQFRDKRTLGSMRQQYQDAQEQAQQNKTDMTNWQSQIRRDDEKDYQEQLAASQKEMAAGTQASKDKAALEAQEKEVERGTKAMDRGALAAQAAQQQMDSNEAARVKEEADAKKESYARVKTDLGKKRLAQQYAQQNIGDVQQREEGINVENQAAYEQEAERARQEYLDQQQRTVPLPQEAEVTSMPLPAKGSPNRPAGKRKLTAEEAERARLKQTGFDVGTSATVTQPNMPPYQPPKPEEPKGKYPNLQRLMGTPAGKKRLGANVLRKPKKPTMAQRAKAGNTRQAATTGDTRTDAQRAQDYRNKTRAARIKRTGLTAEQLGLPPQNQQQNPNMPPPKKKTGPPPRKMTSAQLTQRQQQRQQQQQQPQNQQGMADVATTPPVPNPKIQAAQAAQNITVPSGSTPKPLNPKSKQSAWFQGMKRTKPQTQVPIK